QATRKGTRARKGPKIGLFFEHPTETGRRGKIPVAAATSKRPRPADWESTETAETMRTRAPGSSHENCCFMGQFRKFMTIQPIFDATGPGPNQPATHQQEFFI